MNHMLHGAVTRIGGAIKRIEGADGAKYSLVSLQIEKCVQEPVISRHECTYDWAYD